MNDFIIKASALALKDVPEVNASWVVDNGEGKTVIRQFRNVDVSVAVATPTGLLTPIVTGADRRGLADISMTMKDLGLRAREGRLKVNEIQVRISSSERGKPDDAGGTNVSIGLNREVHLRSQISACSEWTISLPSSTHHNPPSLPLAPPLTSSSSGTPNSWLNRP